MLNTFIPRTERVVYVPRSMDEPVGNPFGGPAYGLKEEPISAAFAAVAAGTAGAAAIATVIGTVAVGATVIGAVTGSKGLMKLGQVLGVVGAVVGIGAATGILGGATEAAASSGVGEMMSGLGDTTADIVAGSTGEVASGIGSISSTAPSAADAIATQTSPFQNLAPNVNDAFGATKAADLGQQAAQNAINANTTTTAANNASTGLINNAGTASQVAATEAYAPTSVTADVVAAGGANTPTSQGWLDKMLSSDRVVEGGLKLGGNVIQGIAQGKSAEEQLRYKAQQEEAARQRASAAGRLYVNGLIGA